MSVLKHYLLQVSRNAGEDMKVLSNGFSSLATESRASDKLLVRNESMDDILT